MNTKVTYVFAATAGETEQLKNSSYYNEVETIVFGESYDFGDWLIDSSVNYEQEDNMYYVLNDQNERTGEAFKVIKEEETMEAEASRLLVRL